MKSAQQRVPWMVTLGLGIRAWRRAALEGEFMAGATVGLIHLQFVISPLATQLLTWWGIERLIKWTGLLLSRQGELTEVEKLSIYFKAVFGGQWKGFCPCLVQLFVWNWIAGFVLDISNYRHSQCDPLPGWRIKWTVACPSRNCRRPNILF